MSSALLPETMQAVYAHVVSDKIDYHNNQRPAIRCNKCGHQFSNASFVPILDQTSLQSAQLPPIPTPMEQAPRTHASAGASCE